MFVRAALQGRQFLSCPAVTRTGVYAGAMVHPREMHTSFPRLSEEASAPDTDERGFYGTCTLLTAALERSSPLIHTRLSYMSPSTRPDSKEKHYVPMSAHVFNVPPHQHAMHMAVVYYLDAMRMGTASTKTRSEVAFSGRKLRPQKGSGKARLGDAGSPMLRKGGVAHGPRPRDFKTELPRKVRELALRSALSARMREGRLHVVPSLEWQPAPMSTNKLARLLGSKQWTDTLFLTAPRRPVSPVATERGAARASSVDLEYTDEQVLRHARYVRNFAVASRNLPDVALMRLHALEPHPHPRLEHTKQPGELHAYEVLQFSRVVMDLGALEWLEEKLGGSLVHEMYKEELRFWDAACQQDTVSEDAPAPSEEPVEPAPAPSPTTPSP